MIEKRAALWVYEQVKNQRRDPGVLFHAPDGSVTLKVFPFAGGEMRRTGFEIIHRDPFVLSLNGREWPLGSPAVGWPARGEEIGVESGLYYLPVEVKRRLPEVNREPYYHFVIDCSAQAAPDLPRCRAAIRSFLARRPLGSPERAKVSLANHSMQTHDWQEDWEGAAFKAEGALFLDRVLKTILFRHHVAGGMDYPVIVLVSPDLSGSVWLESLHDFSLTSPESDCYYHLDLQGTVRTCSLYSPPDLSRPIEPIGSPSGAPEMGKKHPVVAWRGRNGTPVYLRRDDRASIVLPGNAGFPTSGERGRVKPVGERGVSAGVVVVPDAVSPVRRARFQRGLQGKRGGQPPVSGGLVCRRGG